MPLRLGYFTPGPWGKAVEGPGAYGIAHQAQGGKPHSGRHAAYLPVPAFTQLQFEPRGRDACPVTYGRIPRPQRRFRDAACLRGQCGAIAQCDTRAQLVNRGVGGFTFHLNPVGFFHLVTRMGQTRLQRTHVREYHKPLAVEIEASGRAHMRDIHIILEGRSAFGVAELCEHAKRLVENEHPRHYPGGTACSPICVRLGQYKGLHRWTVNPRPTTRTTS